MANTASKRRQRGSIRPHGDGFQVRVYADHDPLTKKEIRLTEQAETWPEAEKIRTRLLNQVDEQRHPKTQVTMSFLLDRWLGVAQLDVDTSYERAEGLIRNYLKPTFGDLKAGKNSRPRCWSCSTPASGSAGSSAKAGAMGRPTPGRSRSTSACRSLRTLSARFTSSCGPHSTEVCAGAT
ncbi:hypothetical protein [Streptomyces chattanoogensis]|uniref:hypothetical protein n=1 Tax=Streptomyces chattanoogensis TaxID=66876 RepID=UPI0036B46694